MSDTTEVIQSTIDKVLERVDLLAAKLGIAAKEIWRFSVTAKVVEAKRDLAKSAALMIIPIIFWGWSIHVLTMKIPHDIQTRIEMIAGDPKPCDQIGILNGKQVIMHEQCWPNVPKTVTEDKGVSNIGWLFVFSGILAGLGGLGLAGESVSGAINAIASAKTAEYDAYQDLIYDWKD